MGYTRDQILDKCSQAIAEIETFYTQLFVNYTGKTTDTKELYTEVVAEFVFQHAEEFKKIKTITRGKPYKVETHDGHHDDKTNRLEEKNAMEMFCQSQDGYYMENIGRIIDYQTPLKDSSDDKAGKIDLLAEAEDAVYILELKRQDSKETMLRCVLEGYTYWSTVDKDKLKMDFKIDKEKPIYAAPLVFKGGKQWKELQGDERNNHPNLIKLMEKLDIKGPFYIVLKYDIEK